MKRNRFFLSPLSLLAAIISFCIAPGLIAQSRITLGERIAKAELIVVGQVQNIESKWDEKKASIWTYVTISVEEYVKGSPPAGSLIVMVPGGTIKEENIAQSLTIPVPGFRSGEKVLLMLSLLPDQPYYYVVDSPHGKYSINAPGDVLGENETRQEFIQKIKSIIASEK
jgi:hypothetical protein